MSAAAAPAGNTERVTIRDVAERAAVNVSTVSRALDPAKASLISHETRERVLEAARELNYRPHLGARSLRRGQTMTVGVVLPDLANPIFAPLARGITHALEPAGWMPLVADTQEDRDRHARILELFVERRVDAIITAALRTGEESMLRGIHDSGVPVITVIRTAHAAGLPSIAHDNRAGAAAAARHLLDLGHRRFAKLDGPDDIESFATRSAAFADTVNQVGATVVTEHMAASSVTLEEARRLAFLLLDMAGQRRPTALFAPNDRSALGVLEAVRALGLRCPEDVSVVSYNDSELAAHTDPPLTSVRLPSYEIGMQAGRLAPLVAGDPAGQHMHRSLPPVLTVRSSTAPPPLTPPAS